LAQLEHPVFHLAYFYFKPTQTTAADIRVTVIFCGATPQAKFHRPLSTSAT
jgi:regulator of RNase E activity RraA